MMTTEAGRLLVSAQDIEVVVQRIYTERIAMLAEPGGLDRWDIAELDALLHALGDATTAVEAELHKELYGRRNYAG